MTGYTVHTGSSVKFSDGWDKVFAKSAKRKAPITKASAKKPTVAKKKASTKKHGGR